MITIKTEYLGQLRTESKHLRSQSKLITDAPVDNNGKGEAFSPTDLVATALGSCMMTIMGIHARKDDLPLQGTTLEITKIMAANPRRIAEIHVKIDFPQQLQLTEIQQEKLKKVALTCPVALSLHPEIKQEVEFNFSS